MSKVMSHALRTSTDSTTTLYFPGRDIIIQSTRTEVIVCKQLNLTPSDFLVSCPTSSCTAAISSFAVYESLTR